MDYKELLKKAKKCVPVNRETSRFEMPYIRVTSDKQTVIKNFGEIAKALRRDPKHLAKFLFKELAMPGSFSSGELVLQGKVSPSLVEKRVHEYVKEFVLCHECSRPDTVILKVGKIEMIKCEACGAKKSLRQI
jgi:translation initiation factor 2 subunit 2